MYKLRCYGQSAKDIVISDITSKNFARISAIKIKRVRLGTLDRSDNLN